MYCKNCGAAIVDGKCPVCGTLENSNNTTTNYISDSSGNTQDANNVGLNVLSFFFPIVGLILYLVWKDQYPIKAKGCGKFALISAIVSAVLTFVSYALLGAAFVTLGGSATAASLII